MPGWQVVRKAILTIGGVAGVWTSATLWQSQMVAAQPEVFSVTHIGHHGERSWRVTCTLTWVE
jgi:hypothetical protein